MASITPTIDLLEFEGLGLVVPWPGGVRYTNQVAGHGCEHPAVEGVFAPLSDGIGRPVVHSFHQHFRGNWHPLTERDADIVDGILRSAGLGFIFTLRAKLAESREAWVWVGIRDADAASKAGIEGFGGKEAILTWANSD